MKKNGSVLSSKNVSRTVRVALLIALAVVVRSLSYMVYFGGAPGMRIEFAGIFTKLSAVLFGPLFGGMASGLTDIIGFLMKPEGGYIPWLTVTAITGGVVTGFLWNAMRKIEVKKLRLICIILFAGLGVLGAWNHILLSTSPDGWWAQKLELLGKNRDFATFGLEAAMLLGAIFVVIDSVLNRVKKNDVYKSILHILLATGISGILVSTLNTYVLQQFIPALGEMDFLVFLVPRLIKEVIMTVIQAYFIALLLSLYHRYLSKDN